MYLPSLPSFSLPLCIFPHLWSLPCILTISAYFPICVYFPSSYIPPHLCLLPHLRPRPAFALLTSSWKTRLPLFMTNIIQGQIASDFLLKMAHTRIKSCHFLPLILLFRRNKRPIPPYITDLLKYVRYLCNSSLNIISFNCALQI